MPNVQRNLAKAIKLGINPIAGFGNKARQVTAAYKASPRGNRNLQPQQFSGSFDWFTKPSKTMAQTYPWSGGKHAAPSAQGASKNAYGTTYTGKRRSGVEKDNMNGYI